jgi:hypothetical protein
MDQAVKSFLSLCFDGYKMAPGIAAMKANPGYRNWANDVISLSQREELEPYRRVLGEIVEDRLSTLRPLERFTKEEARSILFKSCQKASCIGEAETQRNPCAGFVLSWVALIGWGYAVGDRLYAQDANGMPDSGWTTVPRAYVSAALKLGDLYGTKGLVDASYNVLMASRFRDYPDIMDALRKYRVLADKIHQRLEIAIENLADDLHRSAYPAPAHLRAEIMALLWSLGFIPECQSMRVSDYVPSRSFLKKIVWLSLERLPYDPLTQFVWLEMKDKPPFSLRNHRPIFDRINLRYFQYHPDEIWGVAPSRAYALTLIAWLKGKLDSEEVGQYLAVIEQVREYENARYYADQADWSIYLRMTSLAYVLARTFDWFEGDISKERELEVWHSMWSQATRVRGQYHLNPHRPDLSGTLNYPFFHLVEHELDTEVSEPAAVTTRSEKIINELEQYRAAALSYSLTVSPPFVGDKEERALGDLLNDEHEQLQWLRGAFFLVHYEFLPDHFHRYTRYSGTLRRNDPKRFLDLIRNDPKPFLNLETGREKYGEVKERLNALFETMKSLAPEYATRRMDPCAEIDLIHGALRSHSVDTS